MNGLSYLIDERIKLNIFNLSKNDELRLPSLFVLPSCNKCQLL